MLVLVGRGSSVIGSPTFVGFPDSSRIRHFDISRAVLLSIGFHHFRRIDIAVVFACVL